MEKKSLTKQVTSFLIFQKKNCYQKFKNKTQPLVKKLTKIELKFFKCRNIVSMT